MTFAFGKPNETESGNENMSGMGHPYMFHLPPISQSGTRRFGSVAFDIWIRRCIRQYVNLCGVFKCGFDDDDDDDDV